MNEPQQASTSKNRLYQDAQGNLVEVTKTGDQEVEYFPQGGGPLYRMTRAKFDETFTAAQEPVFTLINVTADGFADDVSLPAYSNGRLWNGWQMPHFERDVAMRLTTLMPDVRYDAGRDAFVVHDHVDNEENVYTPEIIRVGDKDVTTYSIGAGMWCWETVLDLSSAERIADYLKSSGLEAGSTGGGFSAWFHETVGTTGRWTVMVSDQATDTDAIQPGQKIAVGLYAPGAGPETMFEVIDDAKALPDVLYRFQKAGVEQFGRRVQSESKSPDTIAEAAAFAFWALVAEGYPEMTTGDSRSSGEDVGAFYQWLTGEQGDYPVQPLGGFHIPTAAAERFRAVVDGAIDEAGAVLREANVSLPAVPLDVRKQLDSCVTHLLHWNFPEDGERESDEEGQAVLADKPAASLQRAATVAQLLGGFMAAVDAVNSAFDGLPEEMRQEIVDWAQKHPNVAGGGFDVAQLLSMAKDDLAAFIKAAVDGAAPKKVRDRLNMTIWSGLDAEMLDLEETTHVGECVVRLLLRVEALLAAEPELESDVRRGLIDNARRQVNVWYFG